MLVSCAFSVFFCNGLLRQYLAHSLFSFVRDCYVSISRILCFLLSWNVMLVSCTFSVFYCNGLLRQYLAHSLFSLVTDCYVSILRILCFSPVLHCYVSILRILCFLLYWIVTLVSCTFPVFFCNGLLREYLAHSLFSFVRDCYVSISRILFSFVTDCYVSILRILCFLL